MTDQERVEQVKGKIVDNAVDHARDDKWRRMLGIALILGVLGIVGLAAMWIASTERTAALEKQVGGLSQQARQLASDGQVLVTQVRGLGGTPSVQPLPPSQIPGPQGSQGPRGDRGPGITGTQIVNGHLIVSYSDGPPVDVGQVAGKDGAKGPDGRSIVGETLANGHLILAFSDNTTTDVGVVVGKDGATGNDGRPGRGVASSAIDSRWHLIVTYDDHTSQDVGPLPPGPQGPAGPSGVKGDRGDPGPACPPGYELGPARITAKDGSTYDGVACVKPGSRQTTTATTIPPLPGR